jgi:transposase
VESAIPRRKCDRKAGGRPTVGTPAFSLSDSDRARVLAEACRKPSDVGIPITHWSSAILGAHLRELGFGISDSTTYRILSSAALQPHRQKMWLTSHDEEFRTKRDDVLRVYYDTPGDEHIISVDEKTGMQALERRFADLPMRPGQPVRREFEYIRHGTITLMGAFDVRRGKLFGFVSKDHNGDTFVDLLDVIDECYPSGRGHIICDNLSAHDTDDVFAWFEEHPRWTRHFTPKHASWLNQIEDMFSIVQSRVLARGSFRSTDELCERIYEYMLWHNDTSQPFNWTYRPKSWGDAAPVVHRFKSVYGRRTSERRN